MPDLSDINYQSRPTVFQKDSSDDDFAELKKIALSKLEVLITECKNARQSSKNKNEQEKIDNSLKKIEEDSDKIKNLAIIDIKQDDGKVLKYCTSSEKTEGVTEKVSLVLLSTTKARLQELIDTNPKNYQTYLDKRDSYQIKTEAILKLPKHGKVKEVQHEAIALNISRQLGFDTTKSTMVSYKNKPALFVPFEDIQLLKDFVESDKPMEKGKNKDSTNYSTIKSVGESLKPDSSIEDFGKTLAFFYLCNDSDAIGGYAQNKALRNNKSLYIFDQVIMLPLPTLGDSLSLDSRMSLSPANFIAGTSRHLLGRNKTLIEDSSFDTKFNSVVNLLLKKDDIIAHLDTVIENHKASLLKAESDITKIQEFIKRHEAQINEFRTKRKNAKTADSDTDHNISLLEEALFEINQQLSERQEIMRDLSDLLADAENIKETLVNRFDKTLFDALPKFDGKKLNEAVFLENQETIKQSLVLEKLLNCPRLFTEDGRPYKYPWTDKNILKVTNMRLGNGKIELTFNTELSSDFLKAIEKLAGIDAVLKGENVIHLDINDLLKLKETALFPEMIDELDINKKYLDQHDHNALGFLSQFYGVGHRGRVTKAITLYEKTMMEYELVLISTLPENNKKKAEKGKIYLSEDGTYVVHNFDGKIFAGTIHTKNIDLKNLDVKIKEDAFRKKILETTSKAGHTAPSKTTEEKLKMMQDTVSLLTGHLQDAADRGFIKHVLLKLQFDIQQQLQKMISEQYSNVNVNSNSNENLNITLIDKVNLAFNAALKLDRVAMFNEVLILAIRTNSLDDNFVNYLDKCIEYGKSDNYAATKEASEALYALQEQTRQDYLTKVSSKVSTNASINIFKAESRSARSSITVPTKSSSEPIVPLGKKS